MKFPQSVMIWGAVTSAGVGPLCFIKSKVNAAIWFKSLHSTENVLVFKLYFITTDSVASAVLLMLNLSSAFDTVCHEILICRLNSHVGRGGGGGDGRGRLV